MAIIRKNYSGSIGLTTVVVLNSLLLIAGLTTVLLAVDLRRATGDLHSAHKAKMNAWTCLEESIQRIKYNDSFTGTLNIDLDNGTCESIVSDDQPGIKNMEITATYEGFSYDILRKLDISVFPFELID